MNYLKYITAFIFAIASLNMFSQNIETGRVLEVNEIVELSLKSNPNIVISAKQIEISKGYLQSANAEFNVNYAFNISKSHTITPSTLDFRSGYFDLDTTLYNESNLFYYSLSASKKFKSGLVVTPGFSLNNTGKDELYNKLNDANLGKFITGRGNVYLNIHQPLLLGRGKQYNIAKLDIARINLNASEHQHIYNTSYQVLLSLVSYINYIDAYKNYEIQLQTEQSYQSILSQLEKLVEYDAIPASDLTYIKANLSTQSSIRLEAQNNISWTKHVLGETIGLEPEQVEDMKKPPDKFNVDMISISDSINYVNRCFRKSLEKRHDYLALNYLLQAEETQINYLKKSIKPNLNLDISAGYNGIYESNNFVRYYQPFAQNINGINYLLGLTFDIAPKFDKEKGELLSSLAFRDEINAQKDALEKEIYRNINNYFNQIAYYNNIVSLYKKAIEYNEEALDNEYTKLKLGISTIINVVQLRNNYTYALNNYYNAVQELNLSIIYLKFHSGTLFETTGSNSISVDYEKLFFLPFK